ncbi:hypothetical protein FF52_09838 [Flavobacterium sp. F52]|nr:hypothetical protein FF52_09838 [Flavobacterium sp. F52]
MKNITLQLFIVAFNIIASLLIFGDEKLLFHIDDIWIHFLFVLLIIWNLILFYMLAKPNRK